MSQSSKSYNRLVIFVTLTYSLHFSATRFSAAIVAEYWTALKWVKGETQIYRAKEKYAKPQHTKNNEQNTRDGFNVKIIEGVIKLRSFLTFLLAMLT